MPFSDSTLELTLLSLYYLVLGILSLYGLHRLRLLAQHLRAQPIVSPTRPGLESWPRVAVQLPIFNEKFVADRLIRAVAAFDYPRDRFEIQVLDDSTDETTPLIAEVVAELAATGLGIAHIRRADRRGYKAGALAHGLSRTNAELVAIFDADFVPPPDFLRCTVPSLADPGIGMVQARWDHLNRDASLLTRAQAMLLDGHFLIEHAARHRSGCFFNFNGTAGVWRRRTIEDAGGWQHDTLTEDLDLSYRAQLAGWRFEFLPSVAVPAELPLDVAAFKAQQRRWARGSVQTCRKLLLPLLRTPLEARVRREAVVHLTANFAYPLMVLLSILVFPAMWIRRDEPPWHLLAIDLPLFCAATISVLAYFVAGQRARGATWNRALRDLVPMMATGIGLSLNNGAAVLAGLRRTQVPFERTPKQGTVGRGLSRPTAVAGYGARMHGSTPLEGIFALYFMVAVVLSVQEGMWWCLPFLYLFLHGYAYLFALSVAQLWRRAPVLSGAA